MDIPDRRLVSALHPPPRRRRRPRRYLSHLSLLPDPHADPTPPTASLPLLHRVLSGLRALPADASTPPAAPAPPRAGWKCTVAGCLWESINPMSHPCPFPPSAEADAPRSGAATFTPGLGVSWCAASSRWGAAPGPGTATLADLTRRLLARAPSLGAPPEEREPSPDVVITQALPVVDGPVVSAQGGGR